MAQPASYDLRDYGWITPTKDQGALGTCWAFASTTAFQSSLLRQGLAASPTDADLLDLSIWHLATRNGSNDPDLIAPYDQWGEWGGLNNYTEGYLTRGRGDWAISGQTLNAGGGYVSNTSNPNNPYPLAAAQADQNLSPYVPPANQALDPSYRLVSSYSYAGTPSTDSAYRDMLKQAILDRGALSADMYVYEVGNENAFADMYNATHNTYIFNGTAAPNHQITVVGWDDNKAVYDHDNNFVSNGAWLIQNSWGTDDTTSQGGYFWLSYDDTSSLLSADNLVAGTREVPGQPGYEFEQTVEQNQIFAPNEDAAIGADTGQDSIVLSKMAFAEDKTLGGFGLWTSDETVTLTLTIYDTFSGGLLSDSIFTDEYTLDGIGYKEIYLDDLLLFLAGEDIFIEINFGDEYETPILVDTRSADVLDGDFEGLSWMWDEDEGLWQDLALLDEETPMVYFFKGLTVQSVPEPSGAVLLVVLGGLAMSRRLRRKRP